MSDTGHTGISSFFRCGRNKTKYFAACLNYDAAFRHHTSLTLQTPPLPGRFCVMAGLTVRSGNYNIRNPETLCQH